MRHYLYLLLSLFLFFSCKREQEKNINFKEFEKVKTQKDLMINKDTIQKNNQANLYLKKFKSKGLDYIYTISNKIEPNYLKADFDGDKKEDIVYLVEEKQSKKIGLVFLHNNDSVYVIAAGKEFNSRWDEMNWLDILELDKNKTQYEMLFDEETFDVIGSKEVIMPNIGVRIRVEEGSGGLLYFEDGQYKYLHQGD